MQKQIHLSLGSGVMIQGTNGTLLHHANREKDNQTELVLIESHGTARSSLFARRIAHGKTPFNTIEVGTNSSGAEVDQVYPADFVTDAFSIYDGENKGSLMALVQPQSYSHSNKPG